MRIEIKMWQEEDIDSIMETVKLILNNKQTEVVKIYVGTAS